MCSFTSAPLKKSDLQWIYSLLQTHHVATASIEISCTEVTVWPHSLEWGIFWQRNCLLNVKCCLNFATQFWGCRMGTAPNSCIALFRWAIRVVIKLLLILLLSLPSAAHVKKPLKRIEDTGSTYQPTRHYFRRCSAVVASVFFP